MAGVESVCWQQPLNDIHCMLLRCVIDKTKEQLQMWSYVHKQEWAISVEYPTWNWLYLGRFVVHGQYTTARGCSLWRNAECLDTALSGGILAMYHKPEVPYCNTVPVKCFDTPTQSRVFLYFQKEGSAGSSENHLDADKGLCRGAWWRGNFHFRFEQVLAYIYQWLIH